MKDEVIVLCENPVEIDLFKEYLDYLKSMRESYYYLKSLYVNLTEGFVMCSDSLTDEEIQNRRKKLNNYRDRTKKLLDEFNDFEKNKLGIENTQQVESQNVFEEIAVTKENNGDSMNTGWEFEDLVSTLFYSIDKKSEMDLLQIEIINFINDETRHIINVLISDFQRLKNEFAFSIKKELVEYQMNHSVDEDKIVTYIIDVKDKDYNRILRKNGFELPLYHKKRDNTYNLIKARDMYKFYNDSMIHFMIELEKEKEKEVKEKRDKLQYRFNIMIGIMTIITTITAIVTIVIEILTYKYK